MTIYRTVKLYLLSAMLICATVLLCSCEEKLSSSEQVSAFDLAGPITPKVDIDKLLVAKNYHGTYTVGIGDVLEIEMPSILTAISPKLYNNQTQQVQPYQCRVSDSGTITLPIIGKMNIEGKTQAQIESDIFNAYYPKYVVIQPSVVCNIKEYYLRNITIIGAVTQPGNYQLKSNDMSLVSAIMKAGGIIGSGASVIVIKNPLRTYASPQGKDEIKQFAEFAGENNFAYEGPAKNKVDYSALEVEMVFKPEKSGSAQGTLVIRRGKEILNSKKINTQNKNEIIEYVNEMRKTVGSQQAHIIQSAIEQLANQLTPAITANDITDTVTEPLKNETPQKTEIGQNELLEIANDSENINNEKADEKIKKPAETPINDNIRIAEEIKSQEPKQADELIKSADNEQQVDLINEQPKDENQTAAETPKDNAADIQTAETLQNIPAEFAQIINNWRSKKSEIAEINKPAEEPAEKIVEIQIPDNSQNAAQETAGITHAENNELQTAQADKETEIPTDNNIEIQTADNQSVTAEPAEINSSENTDLQTAEVNNTELPIAEAGENEKSVEANEIINEPTPLYAENQSAENSVQKAAEIPTADTVVNKPVESAAAKPKIELVTADTPEAIVLPVQGLNIPFADVPLMEGDVIEVRRLNPAVFTVIGLVKNPNAFPYPPEAEYNLMQAIGFAGGIDPIANPRFVSIYRQDAKGEIVSAVFRVDKKFMAKSCAVKIKPGDIISVDITARTQFNLLIHQVLRLNFGLYFSPNVSK